MKNNEIHLIGDSSLSRYRNAMWSLGGEDHWEAEEQEKWIIDQFGVYVLRAIKISSGLIKYEDEKI